MIAAALGGKAAFARSVRRCRPASPSCETPARPARSARRLAAYHTIRLCQTPSTNTPCAMFFSSAAILQEGAASDQGAHDVVDAPAPDYALPNGAQPSRRVGNRQERRSKGTRRTMKAAIIEQFGGPEVLQYGDLPDPVAGAGRGRRRRRRGERQRRRLESARRRIWRRRSFRWCSAAIFPAWSPRSAPASRSQGRRCGVRRARSRPRGRLCREDRDQGGDHRQEAGRRFRMSTPRRWRSPA